MEQFYTLHRSPGGILCVCTLGLVFSLCILLVFSSSSPLLHLSWLPSQILFSNPLPPFEDVQGAASYPPTSSSLAEPLQSAIPPFTQYGNESSNDIVLSAAARLTGVHASKSAPLPTGVRASNSAPHFAFGSSSPTSPPPLRSNDISTCDMSMGKWVQDGSHYPLYRPASCPYADEAFSCQVNGRPDSEYLKWKWKPYGCDLPRFNAQKVLEKLRGKRMVFAGDSMMRNQWESMLCLLREGLDNKSRMMEMKGQRITKGRGDYVFKFLDYNARVEFYRSHFLVAEGRHGRGRSGRPRLTLRIDTIDRTSRKWENADVLIFTTGHWWTHGKVAKGKDYFQEGETVYESLPVMVAFEKAMKTWGAWIDKKVNSKRTKVFFSGYSPSHFHGGQWNSGGHCNNEEEPIFDESLITSYPEKMLVIEDIVRLLQKPVRILNVTRSSEFRKDAHPSVFGQVPQGHTNGKGPRQDCSHWCLPGVPDVWNEMLLAYL